MVNDKFVKKNVKYFKIILLMMSIRNCGIPIMTDLIPFCLRSQKTGTTVYAGKTGPCVAKQ